MPADDLIEERRDYIAHQLHRDQLSANPVLQFTHWLKDVRELNVIDATAMALSTVDAKGRPHTRIVLLKQFDKSGFSFYTNYVSDKGKDLDNNPYACILFYWRELERQVRIEGLVRKLVSAEADTYFHSRPEGSRFSAAASPQSSPVANRAVLEKKIAALKNEYPDGKIPRPDSWGGYRLIPDRFEFWQGRADRLHDRFQYALGDDSHWQIERLAP